MAQLDQSFEARQRWERQRSTVPAQLRHLAQRELEVAQLVLSRGEVTANEVVNSLSVVISNSAVRSMLSRLVVKNILRKERRNGAYYYRPCREDAELQERAIKKLSDDYFEGSVSKLLEAVAALLARDQQSTPGRSENP
jgi:predicted transcriptional regulator